MINKIRLKVSYKDNLITIDVDENISFKELGAIINEKLLLNKCKYYEFIHNNNIIDSVEKKENVNLHEYLEMNQKIIYHTGTKSNPYTIKIVVWDYIFDSYDNTMLEKFMKLVKKINKAKPKQVYHLNKAQRKYIDIDLKDCYESLKEHNFGGVYHYRFLKKGKDFLFVKLIYYMLDDKYELYLYDSKDKVESEEYQYLVTFYDSDRTYFKGYQSRYRNTFVICKDGKTLRSADFVYLYISLNYLTYMLNTVDSEYLFASHDNCLVYDIASDKYWSE